MNTPDYDHDSLRLHVLQLRKLEQAMLGLGNQRGAMERAGLPPILLGVVDSAIEQIRPTVDGMKRRLPKFVAGSRIGAWVEGTRGLGPGVPLLLGTLPPLVELHSVGALFKYVGLHVEDGRAVRRARGEKSGFASYRRAYALYRIGDPMMKSRGAYRHVYDTRKARTLEVHPPMAGPTDCEFCAQAWERTKQSRAERDLTRERTAPGMDCANVGGVHWSDGHRHNDALRVMTKEILRDAHRVAHGLMPLYGGADSTIAEAV